MQNLDDMLIANFEALKVSAMKKASRAANIALNESSLLKRGQNVNKDDNKTPLSSNGKLSTRPDVTFSSNKILSENEIQRREFVRKAIERRKKDMDSAFQRMAKETIAKQSLMTSKREKEMEEDIARLEAVEEHLAQQMEINRKSEEQRKKKESEEISRKIAPFNEILQSRCKDLAKIAKSCKDITSANAILEPYSHKLKILLLQMDAINEKNRAGDLTAADMKFAEVILIQSHQIIQYFKAEIDHINGLYDEEIARRENQMREAERQAQEEAAKIIEEQNRQAEEARKAEAAATLAAIASANAAAANVAAANAAAANVAAANAAAANFAAANAAAANIAAANVAAANIAASPVAAANIAASPVAAANFAASPVAAANVAVANFAASPVAAANVAVANFAASPVAAANVAVANFAASPVAAANVAVANFAASPVAAANIAASPVAIANVAASPVAAPQQAPPPYVESVQTLAEQEPTISVVDSATAPAVPEQLVIPSIPSPPKEKPKASLDKESMTLYIQSKMLIQNYTEKYENLKNADSLKKFRFECQKAINIPVNAITGTSKMHLIEKYEKVKTFLQGKSTPNVLAHPEGEFFCKNTLALKIVDQGETLVSSKPEMAFSIAAVAVALCNDFPDLGELLIAHFRSKSPYLIPLFTKQTPDQSIEDYYMSLGCKFIDGALEDSDKFQKRLSGLMRLYASIIITKQRTGIDKPHPHGLQNAWRWLATIMNYNLRVEVCEVCATLIFDLLEVTGRAMWETYPKQFPKLLHLLVSTYCPKMKELCVNNRGPLMRLEAFLSKSLTNGSIPPPVGQLPPNFW